MDEHKPVEEMTPEELKEELALVKQRKQKRRRQSIKDQRRSLEHLEKYLKAYHSLYK